MRAALLAVLVVLAAGACSSGSAPARVAAAPTSSSTASTTTSTTEPLASVPAPTSPLHVVVDAAPSPTQSHWDSFRVAGHHVLVLVPAEYGPAPAHGFPVVVLLHGEPGKYVDWVRGGNVDAQFDALLAAGRVPPVLLVIPDLFGDAEHGAPGCPDLAEAFLFHDVLSEIDHRYRTNGERAIGGVSDGGGCAVLWGTRHPDAFKAAFALVGFFPIEPTARNGVPVFLLDGIDDTGSRRQSDVVARNFGVDVRMVPGRDHGWESWRGDLGIALPFAVSHLRDAWPLRTPSPLSSVHVGALAPVPDGYTRLLAPSTDLRI